MLCILCSPWVPGCSALGLVDALTCKPRGGGGDCCKMQLLRLSKSSGWPPAGQLKLLSLRHLGLPLLDAGLKDRGVKPLEVAMASLPCQLARKASTWRLVDVTVPLLPFTRHLRIHPALLGRKHSLAVDLLPTVVENLTQGSERSQRL